MNEKIIYFDIETVHEEKTHALLNYDKRRIWGEKYCNDTKGLSEESFYYKKASMHPEFAKIICITIGMYDVKGVLKTKSFYSDEEAEIIRGFFKLIDDCAYDGSLIRLCGHNIIGFDIPFIYRRSIINRIKPHKTINLVGVKKRDIEHIDTMDQWKGTGFISTGLESIAICLGIPSPKSKMDGSKVGEIYWRNFDQEGHNKDLNSIAEYCEEDVKTVAAIHKIIKNPEVELIPEQIMEEEIVSEPINKEPALFVSTEDLIINTPKNSKESYQAHQDTLQEMIKNDDLPF